MEESKEKKEKSVASSYLYDISLDLILGKNSLPRKTKIICTLGPSINTVQKLQAILRAGMNVARFNFSHGDHESHKETLDKLRQAMENTKLSCAVMLDTKGPQIRTGFLKDHKPIQLKAGQDLILTTDYEHLGDQTKIACSYKSLPQSVKPGSEILMADGSITAEVKQILKDGVKVEVKNDMTLGERKNMNLPGVVVDLPTLTQKDADDIKKWGIPNGIDAIAASFVRKASDIKEIRSVLGIRGKGIKIIAKIQNQEGLHNYSEILQQTDGIMVARGDLGMEIPPQKVFLAQKWMIKLANMKGKPVVTATQMLESMIQKPRPTRAEATDVANAVLDGSDCVMLSGETAGGKYPLEAVTVMAEVCVEAQACINYKNLYREMTGYFDDGSVSTGESVALSAVQTARVLNCSLIVVLTEHGNSARLIAKYRPEQMVLGCSINKKVVNQLGFSRGVFGLKIASFIQEGPVDLAILEAKKRGLCKSGDRVIAIHGKSDNDPTNSDMMRVIEVE